MSKSASFINPLFFLIYPVYICTTARYGEYNHKQIFQDQLSSYWPAFPDKDLQHRLRITARMTLEIELSLLLQHDSQGGKNPLEIIHHGGPVLRSGVTNRILVHMGSSPLAHRARMEEAMKFATSFLGVVAGIMVIGHAGIVPNEPVYLDNPGCTILQDYFSRNSGEEILLFDQGFAGWQAFLGDFKRLLDIVGSLDIEFVLLKMPGDLDYHEDDVPAMLNLPQYGCTHSLFIHPSNSTIYPPMTDWDLLKGKRLGDAELHARFANLQMLISSYAAAHQLEISDKINGDLALRMLKNEVIGMEKMRYAQRINGPSGSSVANRIFYYDHALLQHSHTAEEVIEDLRRAHAEQPNIDVDDLINAFGQLTTQVDPTEDLLAALAALEF
ncbi:hypothetical protein BT63DRAFT_211194 [Microthyrium microscopicum]|uniref:Uncharacterized protein n=1 Tax=Microthyrium microscopicum TaxID=703497 RepID=A0A6A6UHS9_9PEZI|nr:hypothetical protein BT63DRAFT_211194 [Microthyrium microscopicum]